MGEANALKVAIDLLGSGNKKVIEYVGKFGRDVLAGGSSQFQKNMIEYFQSGESHFFIDMSKLLDNYAKDFSSLSVSVPQKGDYIIPLLQMLQNLCESQNVTMKNLMREQTLTSTNIKENASQSLIKSVSELADINATHLIECFTARDVCGKKVDVLESIKLATQCWHTLTEFSTGCEQNQITLAHSQVLISAGTLFSPKFCEGKPQNMTTEIQTKTLEMRVALIGFVLCLTEGLSVRESNLEEHMKSLAQTLLINIPWTDLKNSLARYWKTLESQSQASYPFGHFSDVSKRKLVITFLSRCLILMKVLSPFTSANVQENVFIHTKEPYLSFSNNHIAQIEVVTDKKLQRVHFQLPKSCQTAFDEERRLEILSHLNRDTPAQTLTDFFKSIDALEVETQWEARLRFSYLGWVFKNITNWRWLMSLIALVVNILLIISLTADDFGTGESLEPASFRGIVAGLGVAHIIVSGLFLFTWVTIRIPIKAKTRNLKLAREKQLRALDSHMEDQNWTETQTKSHKIDTNIHNSLWHENNEEEDHSKSIMINTEPETRSTIDELIKFSPGSFFKKIRNLQTQIYVSILEFFDIFNLETVWYIIYFLTSIIATVALPPLFALHLLDVSLQDNRVRTVLRAVTQNGRSLLVTALLGIIVVYQFSMISFFFLRESYSNELPCETLAQCLLTTFSFGIRSGGGIVMFYFGKSISSF